MLRIFLYGLIGFFTLSIADPCFAQALGLGCKNSMQSILRVQQQALEQRDVPSDLIQDQRVLNKMLITQKASSEKISEPILKYNQMHLELVGKALEARGFKYRILKNSPQASTGHDILEILPPEDMNRITNKDLSFIERNISVLSKNETPPSLVYNPIDLHLGRIKGSWNSSRHIMSLPLEALFDETHIPATLIHERLHFEKALAIAQKRTGPLRGFYGRMSGKLEGSSGYSKKGYISFDEVKAWRINVRSQEVGVRNKLNTRLSSPDVLKIQKEGLSKLYENHLKISEDVLLNLEPVAHRILGATSLRDIRSLRIEIQQIEWLKGVKTPTAVLKVSNSWFDEGYAMEIPLVKLKEAADNTELLHLLQEQIRFNLASIRNHRDLARRRLRDFEALDDNPESLLTFLSPR
jgi:hypothetical protein